MKKSVERFEFTEAIRKRPAMYIGGTSLFGLIQYLVCPVAMLLVQSAKRITATRAGDMFEISSDAQVKIEETNGRIAPFEEILPTGWGHSFEGMVLNALSEDFFVSIVSDDRTDELHFKRGALVSRESTTGSYTNPGTIFTFKPDAEIFSVTSLSPTIFESYFRRLSYLHAGVCFSLTLGETTKEFYAKDGIVGLFTAISSPYQLMHEPIHFVGYNGSLKVELIMAFHGWTNDVWWNFINNGRAVEGGTHEKGLFSGLNRLKKRLNLPERFRNGLLGIASIHYPGAVWEGCIKARVGSPELRTMVSQLVLDEGLNWLKDHPAVAEEIPNIHAFEFPDAWYK